MKKTPAVGLLAAATLTVRAPQASMQYTSASNQLLTWIAA